MVRLDDWEKRFSSFLEEKKSVSFCWGKHDCMSFVAGAVFSITGKDFFRFYCNYHDEDSAKSMLVKNGGNIGIINACLGSGHRNILRARRGDVVVVKMPEIMGGVVDDSGQKIALVTKDGLTRVPLAKAWRIWNV